MIDGLHPKPGGILFDYGNTLIPFGQREMDAEGAALVDSLMAALPGEERSLVEARFREVRLRKFRHRRETLEETHPMDLLRETAETFGRELTPDEIETGLANHREVFVRCAVAAPVVTEVLAGLGELGLAIGLVSNFSHAEAIHASLEHLGLRRFFDAVVVSGDLGIVKPHPEIFRAASCAIGLTPAEILFVGDNARLDIAGAKAVGMRTALITEHLEGAYHFERPGEDRIDVEPDLVLERLTDLIPKD